VIVVKYDSAGNQLWDYISPSTGFDGAFAVILDNNEDILITGVANYHFHPFYGVNGGDVFLMKLTANGALSWLSFFDAPDSSYDQGTCIAFDNEGNYYVTGWSKPWIENADGNSKLLILKFDVNGSLIWADSILNAVQNQNCGNESLYLINDRLLFAGVHVDSTGQQFLNASYDLSGNFLWQNVYSSPYGYPKSTCYRSILTKTKKVLNLVGEYSSDPSYPKPRLFEMDTLGNVMNTWKLDSLNAFHQEIQNVQQAQTGEYYLRGYINNGGGNTSVVTAKIEDITTGYQTIISENSLNIFPNPSSSSIFLSGFSFSKNGIEVTITDLTGNKSVQVNLISPSQTINVSALTSGMYLLQAKTSSGSFAGKVCIVH
ncbi:MAG TPA: T9SS type A sorting domain-containing protein, partial [Chitinophagales bacterium]|nr:T9SS type A sorting domain-containing protein [Chitinophagales bacterium]